VTGSWLIVKWAGIAVLAFYLALLLISLGFFRGKFPRAAFVRSFAPVVLGNFVSLSVPSLFESVAVKRLCFVVGHVIYICGIAILLRVLVQESKKVC
jgi:hypothetical protein